jgi:hypothetical protein
MTLDQQKRSWKERLLEELRNLSFTVIYLWVLLSVFVLHRAMILADYHISQPEKFGFAFINALILAKFILIAEAFHAGERSHNKPLLTAILFKSALFSMILVVCHIVEELLVRMWHGKSIGQSLPEISGATLREIFSLGIIMFVVLIPFFATKEIIRVLGKDEFKALILSPRKNPSAVQSKA